MSIWGKSPLILSSGSPPAPPWCRADALIVTAGTVIMTHSGSTERQPIIKSNDGEAAGIFCYNCGGNVYGGNWFCVYVVGKTAADCAISAGTMGADTGTFVYNGNTYYFACRGMNARWGGASAYNNPLNLPTLSGVQTTVINGASLTDAGALAIGNELRLA